MQRIADQVQQVLAQLLLLKASDPRFRTLSVTEVNVSPDMKNAQVFVSALDDEQTTDTLKALNRAAGFFRRELAQTLNLRTTPNLRFVYDTSIARGDRLASLLNQVPTDPQEDKPNE
jgi:ribosome-binding factor A